MTLSANGKTIGRPRKSERVHREAQDRVVTTIHIPAEVERALDESATNAGSTRSGLITEILSQWMRLGRPAFERGYSAGWRAGFREFMNRVNPIGADLERALEDGEIAPPEES